MIIEISDPALTSELVEFLRTKDYLAIEERGQIVAIPLDPVNVAADRRRGDRDLQEWRATHPGVGVEIVAN
jgi:hypothetical protein